MNKRYFLTALSIAVVIILVIPFLFSINLHAVGSQAEIMDVYTDKAMYSVEDTAIITAKIRNNASLGQQISATFSVMHLNSLIESEVVSEYVDANAVVDFNYSWDCPSSDFKGYCVKVTLSDGQFLTTALDVSSDPSRFPRYGFSCDFDTGESVSESAALVEELARDYHINIVQYYDWMWRHEHVVPSATANSWVDMFGNTISKNSITQRINSGHTKNQYAMAYQMAYMAREGYESHGVDRAWGLYRNKNYNISYDPDNLSSLENIDQLIFPLEGDPASILYVFNPENSQWKAHMLNQYLTAINELGFDGIHIDQMGNFWGSIDWYDYYGQYIDIRNTFSSFVDSVREELEENISKKTYLTMNIVNGGIPQKDLFSSKNITKFADTDFSFSEIWENSNTYNDLKNFIEWQRKETGGRALVLAAYMNQYNNIGIPYEAENAILQGVSSTTSDNVTYVSGFDAVGDGVTFTVNVNEAGFYNLVFSYSNGSSSKATKSIYVDGNNLMTAHFDPTRTGMIPAAPSWSAFTSDNAYTTPKCLYLTAGNHSISVKNDTTNNGDIYLDKLTLGIFNENSVRLTDAVIAASGGGHIEIGTGLKMANGGSNYSSSVMLGHPYYPKAYKTMDNSLREAMKSHYDFITAYENLLFDNDVLSSDGGLQNISIAGESISGSGEAGKIWIIPKAKGTNYSILHLINLTSENDTTWRNETSEPEEKSNLQIKHYYTGNRSIQGVYLASPDNNNCLSEELNYSVGSDGRGQYVSFTVPSLQYWDMVYIQWGSNDSGTVVEAENAILSGVAVNTNHAGFSGMGFVDEFGEVSDSVTFDVVISDPGYYSLIFRYANSTGSECGRELIVDNQSRGRVTFLNCPNWDVWNKTEKGVYLESGLHRIVLLSTSAHNGFINLDNIMIEPLSESARSFYLNNWLNTVYVWKNSVVNPIQNAMQDGPSIYEMRYFDGSSSGNYNANQIHNYSMFARNNNTGEALTAGSQFNATGYFTEKGIFHTEYKTYNNDPLPIEISRDYSSVPEKNFLIVRYKLKNNTGSTQNFTLLDMLHVNNLSSNNITASYDTTRKTVLYNMSSSNQSYIAHGTLESTINGYQVANDGVSDPSQGDCSPWVTFNSNGALNNNSNVNAQDISSGFTKEMLLSPGESKYCYFYIALCSTYNDVNAAVLEIRDKSGAQWFSDAEDRYSSWLAGGRQVELDDQRLNSAYDSILVFMKQSIVPGAYTDNSGNTEYRFAAMPATTNPSAYSYKVWARDSAVSAMAMDASGHLKEAEAYWMWLADRQIKTDQGTWKKPGAFWTCYSIWDNAPISFVEPEYDSIGMFLVGAFRHYNDLSGVEKQNFLDKIWGAYKLSADLVCNNIQPNGFGAPDCSIWEEQSEFNAFSQGLYVAGLVAAQQMAEAKGLQGLADSYNGAASTIRSAIQRRSTDATVGLFNNTDVDSYWWYYNRAVNANGTPRSTVDSSSDILMTYGIIDMLSKRAYSHYNKITSTISKDGVGISRYQGDTFYTGKNSWDPGGAEALEDEPSWPQMTMWVAMMELYSGYESLKEQGYERLLWYVDRTCLGYMPAGECVSNITLKPLISTSCEPITGAAYILAALAFDGQFDMRIIPTQHNSGAYKSITINDSCVETINNYRTKADWSQWAYVPYYLDRVNDTVDSDGTRDIERVYLCNDVNNLYLRIDVLDRQLPEYQEAGNLFEVTVYAEDFLNNTGNASSISRNNTNLGRSFAFAFSRDSNSGTYRKYSFDGNNWIESAITSVIPAQWEVNSGRIELAIPLSELARTGLVSENNWGNIAIVLGSNKGAGWYDADIIHLHYRVTSANQTWLFGNSES